MRYATETSNSYLTTEELLRNFTHATLSRSSRYNMKRKADALTKGAFADYET